MTPVLTTLSASELDTVSTRSRDVCIVFRDQPLPAGCQPATVDLAVETTPSGQLDLMVRRGVTSTADDDQLREWLARGRREFDSIHTLAEWLRTRYASAAPSATPTSPTSPATSPAHPAGPAITNERPVPAADELTDLSQVDLPETAAPTVEDLTAAMAARVIGQDEALTTIAGVVARHLAKVRPARPATALLVGPTGCGKTLAAQTLADHLTSRSGTRWEYLRLDMNEFSEKHTASRLFGAPPGYVGYGDGRDLATHLRRHPRTVIVLDEIDKAHPSLWFALMNLLDTGRLVTPAEAPVEAREAIMLLTSNKDADVLGQVAAADPSRVRDTLRAQGYPPEIVGRITSVAVFSKLDRAAHARIVAHTVARVADSYGIQVRHIDPQLITALLAGAPSIEAGVRDLEYHIDALLGPCFTAWRTEHEPDTTSVYVTGVDPVTLTPAEPYEPATPDGNTADENTSESDPSDILRKVLR